MTYKELCRLLTEAVDQTGERIYDEREARAVARVYFEDRHGFTPSDIYGGREIEGASDDVRRLTGGEPVQYVVGKALFADRYFKVRKGVLIPRPETAELCQWIAEEAKEGSEVLDIGTGSGCIAITLALDAKLCATAWDIADEALLTASENAQLLSAEVCVEKQDILNAPKDVARWDIIVSNPPYICEQEKEEMEANVLEHEPHIALFVPDDDPLKFYRAIAKYASKALRKGGRLFFEMNSRFVRDMEQMLEAEGFTDVEIRKDQYGRERMIRGVRREE
ncbi:MAG: peptide chain release factor N(5)-glutamine methyltransferase [Prevotella sp.]